MIEPRNRALDIPTLVDCGCKTHVYRDGSGVEIYYCPAHRAMPDLMAACEEALEFLLWYEGNGEGPTRTASEIAQQVNAAIAKAKPVKEPAP